MESACRVLLEDGVSVQSLSTWVYIGVFLLTCLLEAPIYWWGLSGSSKISHSWASHLWVIFKRSSLRSPRHSTPAMPSELLSPVRLKLTQIWAPNCALFLRTRLGRQLGMAKTLGVIVIVNLATHPVVTWTFPWIFSHSALLTRDYLLVSEAFAVLIEALLLIRIYGFQYSKALSVSFFANIFSWWAGLYIASFLRL